MPLFVVVAVENVLWKKNASCFDVEEFEVVEFESLGFANFEC